MTDPNVSTPSNSPDRLKTTSSARAQYWREAWRVHAEAPALGTGAGAYGTLRLRHRVDERTVRHAHGYVPQTLADLGWTGLGLSLLAALAWIVSAQRVLGLRRRDRGLPWDAERVGLAALACVVVVFGVHSAIDWTWFVPVNVIPAMLCAGWVASRSTLRERLAPREPLPPWQPEVLRFAGAAAILIVAIVAAWSALQPVRAVHALAAASDRVDKGQLDAAASIAQIAHERNPLSVDPFFDLSAVEQARGRTPAAVRALERAVELEPANPETWRRLGRMRLSVLKDPKGALDAFRAALYLDPRSLKAQSDVVVASRAVNAG